MPPLKLIPAACSTVSPGDSIITRWPDQQTHMLRRDIFLLLLLLYR